MALRGSLREFELADIFQLISHDGKTGQLVLSHNAQEGFVIFSQGSIVAAGNGNQNLQTMLFNYLIQVKRYSEEELNELLYLCQGEMRLFSQELTNRTYVSADELSALVKTGIEDLACSLFLWEDGHYRFDSLDSMDEYIIAGVVFPADAITMEAMRRTDEWKRMRRNLSDDTVFSLSPNPSHRTPGAQQSSPLYDPAGYVLSLVDGTSSIAALCERSIFFKYRLYEVLFGLWQDSEIYPLSVKRAPSASARERGGSVRFGQFLAASATLLTVAAWVVLLAVSSFVARRTVFHRIIVARQDLSTTVKSAQAERKLEIARLQHRAEKGPAKASSVRDLVNEGFLDRSDTRDPGRPGTGFPLRN
jgi:hypothetical protein